MSFELDKEFVEQNKLTEDQTKALTDHFSSVIADEKGKIEKEYSQSANKQAEAILDGAAKSVAAQTGIERKEGEKIADYHKRVADEFLASEKTALADKQKQIDAKLKEISNDGASKELLSQLEKLKGEKDDLLKKYADYDELREKATKADEYGQQLTGLKLEVAFNNVKPAFPDTVNPYEAKAKWDEFKKSVLDNHRIELVDGEAIAIDKENHHKQVKLADLVAKDEAIATLKKGRQQNGTGATETEKKTITGVPFDVPADMDKGKVSAAIREHLTKAGVGVASPDYAAKFAELNRKIYAQETVA